MDGFAPQRAPDGAEPCYGVAVRFVLASAALASSLALVACERTPAPEPPARTPAPPPAAEPSAPQPSPVLDRAALLEAGRAAQARYAAGLAPEGAALAGRRVRIETAFGCAGPAPDLEGVRAGWRYDAERKTLRVAVRPTDLLRWLPLPQGVEPAIERADAFWVHYPWLAAPGCPVPREESGEPGAPEAPTLGLLAFRVAGQSRSGATDAYEITKRVEADAAPRAGQGLRRVLEGRVTALPDGRVWACSAPDPERPPTCLLAVDVERVAIVRPDTGEALGEWSRGPT